MKKILLLLVLVSASCISVLSQTYYYKHIENVDNNGVKTKIEKDGCYMSFTKNSCFFSDENGYKVKDGHVYLYKGIKDNLYIYKWDMYEEAKATYGVDPNTLDNSFLFPDQQEYIYFSQDFERMNYPFISSLTFVYIKSVAPKKESTPFY